MSDVNTEHYQLLLGDCLERLKEIPDNSVDLVLTDPPYGTTSCIWDSIIPLEQMWESLKRVAKDNASFIFTASQPFTSILVASNISQFKTEWIWEKNAGSNFGTVRWQPMKEHENVIVFCKTKSTYNPLMQERALSGQSRVKTPVKYNTKTEVYKGGLHNETVSERPELRYPRSIQRFNRERGLHPTQKPVDLMGYFINTYSNPNEVVLDFTMGSGSTGVAAMNNLRRFIGIEKEEKYFTIAQKRIENAFAFSAFSLF